MGNKKAQKKKGKVLWKHPRPSSRVQVPKFYGGDAPPNQAPVPIIFLNACDTKGELEHSTDIQRLLNEMVGNGAFTKEGVRDGKILTKQELVEMVFKGEVERPVSDEPPKPAEYLAYLFLPKTDREILLGDLTEEYPAVAAKFGRRGAQLYFYKQIIWSVWPLIRKSIVRWGLFGWVVELIRKISS